MPRTRPALTGAFLPTVLVAVGVAGAAAGGPWRVTLRVPSGPSWQLHVRPPQPQQIPQHPLSPKRPPVHPAGANHVVTLVLLALATLLALAILVFVARRLKDRLHLPTWRRPPEESLRLPGTPLDAEKVAAAVERAEQAVARPGAPRDAVVAAWVALEDAAGLSGVARDPAKTPTEFVVDVLDRTGADPRATRGLLAVYLHARFSADPVTASEVATAQACLGELRRGIQVSLA